MRAWANRSIIAVLLLLAAGVIWNTAFASKADVDRPVIEETAPAIELKDAEGHTIRLGGSRSDSGKPQIISFWTSWCDSCQAEVPRMNAWFAEYGSQLDFYAINATKDDSRSEAEQFMTKYGVQYPVLFDSSGEAAARYEVQILPTFFLIDRSGKLQDILYGEVHEELMHRKIKELIGSPTV
ncbi:TlpA family protein disulfide reductase [Paenibacillus xylaniclasticus]|uniref:TlpA family protein disulfide reductase n=1 Tax=Paenibacillus xylaniclasticus TaxID=588083 RepID=UPI000FDABF39|nr:MULTISPECIES: TlpA disulfide reductase family protein [Paenibacillus]GFN31428.1 thioredoxin [Paenibacillus curdlanolyticus]